ncbi:hypothetical protein [Falsihalocynthiibacter arcticus]|uniref:Uncharacterized protein n=1 Tax=Falsihalocynthiibacter arcticus TaxID=1579316 RepID=A0A126V2B0_9RHOB|nr:hypothetical protein [Falsihalocynthiibacter arcticus]AML52026.1 hypothetical protein RC74_12760 [Falsihalocynthiibacter arcticus]
MFDHLQNAARRSFRWVALWTMTAAAGAIGAGFLTAAALAGLDAAALSKPLALLVVGAVWFGFACLGALVMTTRLNQRLPQEPRAQSAPPLADAFTAGLEEGSRFASRNRHT